MRLCRIKTPSRGIVLGCLLGLVAIGGACTVRDTTSIADDQRASRETIRALGRRPTALAAQSENVPTNGTDASGRVDFPQSYATPTLVDIQMSGWITRTNKYTGQKDYIGPGGYNNCNSGATVLRWNGGGGWWLTNDCTNGKSPVSGAKEIVGAVWADRNAMGTTCGQGPAPCFTYTGNILVTLTPRAGTLSLSCTPSEITATEDVSCTLTSSLPNYTSNISWAWTDPSPANEARTCGLSCTFYGRSWSGTVTATATVNGEVKTVAASVRRRCITGDTLINTSGPLRAALQEVIDSSLGRPFHDEFGRSVLPSGAQPAPARGVPCQVGFPFALGRIAVVHAHGLTPNVPIPNSLCFGDSSPGVFIPGRGLSENDAIYAWLSGGPAYAIDRDTIYRIFGPTVPIDTSQVTSSGERLLGVAPNWRDGQSAIARTGPNACVLP